MKLAILPVLASLYYAGQWCNVQLSPCSSTYDLVSFPVALFTAHIETFMKSIWLLLRWFLMDKLQILLQVFFRSSWPTPLIQQSRFYTLTHTQEMGRATLCFLLHALKVKWHNLPFLWVSIKTWINIMPVILMKVINYYWHHSSL